MRKFAARFLHHRSTIPLAGNGVTVYGVGPGLGVTAPKTELDWDVPVVRPSRREKLRRKHPKTELTLPDAPLDVQSAVEKRDGDEVTEDLTAREDTPCVDSAAETSLVEREFEVINEPDAVIVPHRFQSVESATGNSDLDDTATSRESEYRANNIKMGSHEKRAMLVEALIAAPLPTNAANIPATDRSTKPELILFSAHNRASLSRQIELHEKHVRTRDINPADLAHTRAMRREVFEYRAFAILRDKQFVDVSEQVRARLEPPALIMVFTGDEAHWIGMAKEIVELQPSAMEDIERMDKALASLEHPPSWTIKEALHHEQRTEDNEVGYRQVLATAVQIITFRLFERLAVRPMAVSGDSCGEIAAAFAAGLLSLDIAITTAYQLRNGSSTERNSSPRHSSSASLSSLSSKNGVVVACGSNIRGMFKTLGGIHVSASGKLVARGAAAGEEWPDMGYFNGPYTELSYSSESLQSMGIPVPHGKIHASASGRLVAPQTPVQEPETDAKFTIPLTWSGMVSSKSGSSFDMPMPIGTIHTSASGRLVAPETPTADITSHRGFDTPCSQRSWDRQETPRLKGTIYASASGRLVRPGTPTQQPWGSVDDTTTPRASTYGSIPSSDSRHEVIAANGQAKKLSAAFLSSTSGRVITTEEEMTPRDFRHSKRNAVEVNALVTRMAHYVEQPSVVLEIGPNSTLSDSLSQISAAHTDKPSYISCQPMQGGGTEGFLGAIGKLWQLSLVGDLAPLFRHGRAISGLPPYAWMRDQRS